MMVYETIRGANIRATTANNLLGGPVRMAPAMAGMVETGDGRILSGGLSLALNKKKITTTSFDSAWFCFKCSLHNIRPALRTRGEAGGSPRQAIVLSDQNFPATLPVCSTQQCFKIIRMENGAVLDLVSYLVDLVGNRIVPPGSIVFVGSVTHLANVGLVAYVQDIVEAGRIIRHKLGRDVRVSPLPPMLMSGIDSGSVIRELYEYCTWAESYFPADLYLYETFHTALDIIKRTGEGSQTWMEQKRIRLPTSDDRGAMIWHSGGSWVGSHMGPVPYATTALQQPEEITIITSMIKEIRDKQAIDLDPSPAYERGLGGQDRPRQSIDFVIVGSSNASKLCKALKEQGYACELIFTASWKVTTSGVEGMRGLLKETIREKDPTTVILFLLDSSVYYGRQEDGSSMAGRKDDSGVYHIEGELAVCGRETLLRHFNTLKPLLDLTAKKRGILVSPLPRYVVSGCCSESSHCSNRRFPDFEQQLQQQLDITKRNLKDFLFYDGYRQIRVLDPCMDMRHLDQDEAWGDDPIHPTPVVYSKIAAAAAMINDQMRAKETEAKRRRDSLGEASLPAPDARRGRLDQQQEGSPQLNVRGGRGRPRPRGGRWPRGGSVY
jgi:hypothetical protein